MYKQIKRKVIYAAGGTAAALLLFGAYMKPVYTEADLAGVEIPEETEPQFYSSEEKARILRKFEQVTADERAAVASAKDKVVGTVVSGAARIAVEYEAAKINAILEAAESASSSLANSTGLMAGASDSGTSLDFLLGASQCPEGFEAAELLRVCDGDTLFVRLLDGTESYVRLIGVNTPESSAAERVGYSASTKEGELASEYTKKLLSDVSVVWLSKDASDTDKYGRLLRYVWIAEPAEGDADNEDAVKEKMLNARLLEDGMADVMFLNDRKYETLFKELLSGARLDGAGLWGEN